MNPLHDGKEGLVSHLELCLLHSREYTDQGLPVLVLYGVIPAAAGSSGWKCECPMGEACDKPGKHPRRKGWRRSATTNWQRIRSVFTAFPDSNIGIATGRVVVLDFDPRHESDEAERHLVMANGPFPDAPEVLTGGGGRHLYFVPTGGGYATRFRH